MESVRPTGSAAEVGCHAESLARKSSRPKRTISLGTSLAPIAGEDPAWIATLACVFPTVGANCRGDFAAIYMIMDLGVDEDDPGWVDTRDFTQVRVLRRGNKPTTVGCLSGVV